MLGQEPSTATLVELVTGMVRHFMQINDGPCEQEVQRLRLMVTSHLDDGEFARLDQATAGPFRGGLTVTKRADPFDRFQKALRALAGLITALTTAAWTGHIIGWW